MLAFRAVAQRPPSFFSSNREGIFGEHDVKRGVEEGPVGEDIWSDEERYRALFCLVTHQERRQELDVATKTVFAVFLLRFGLRRNPPNQRGKCICFTQVFRPIRLLFGSAS